MLDGFHSRAGDLPRVDDADLPVIHGDLHAHNIWWQGTADDGRVTGLFDFEWARFAEPWADLGRSHERALADVAEGGDCHQRLVPEIASFLPAWQVPDERRALATLGHEERESLLWGPLTSDSPPDHVAHLVDGLLKELGW